jgi:hypothetical protein
VGEDSVNSGRILALMLASEGMAAKRWDPITALSMPGKGVDWLHGDGPSYGNEGCFGLTGVVRESRPLGVVLHDEGSEARKEPEAKVVSIVVIRCEESAYNCSSAMRDKDMKRLTESGRTLMRSENTRGKN